MISIPRASALLLVLVQTTHAVPTVFYGVEGNAMSLTCPDHTFCLRPKGQVGAPSMSKEIEGMEAVLDRALEYAWTSETGQFEFTCEEDKCDLICSTDECTCTLDNHPDKPSCEEATPLHREDTSHTQTWPIFIGMGPKTIAVECPATDGQCVIASTDSKMETEFDANLNTRIQAFDCGLHHSCGVVCPSAKCRCWESNQDDTSPCPVRFVDHLGMVGDELRTTPASATEEIEEEATYGQWMLLWIMAILFTCCAVCNCWMIWFPADE